MKQVSIDEVKNDLSGYLQLAEKESVVITRDGQPVGILIGLEDAEDWWEELMALPTFWCKLYRKLQVSMRWVTARTGKLY
jgi:prevent-host-death family protein